MKKCPTVSGDLTAVTDYMATTKSAAYKTLKSGNFGALKSTTLFTKLCVPDAAIALFT